MHHDQCQKLTINYRDTSAITINYQIMWRKATTLSQESAMRIIYSRKPSNNSTTCATARVHRLFYEYARKTARCDRKVNKLCQLCDHNVNKLLLRRPQWREPTTNVRCKAIASATRLWWHQTSPSSERNRGKSTKYESKSGQHKGTAPADVRSDVKLCGLIATPILNRREPYDRKAHWTEVHNDVKLHCLSVWRVWYKIN